MKCSLLGALSLWLVSAAAAAAAPAPLRLTVDASEVTRRIVHARLAIPAVAGPMTLVYPRWIPGEHGPTGPIASLVGLRVSGRGAPIAWRRDAQDMFAFHLEVPAGVTELDVAFDVVPAPAGANFTAAASSSDQLAVLNWNQVVLYPRGAAARALMLAPSLVLPAGWKAGTALAVARQQGARTDFAPVSLETLIDSPVLAGRTLRTVELAAGPPPHRLHVAADSAAAVAFGDDIVQRYRRLVVEADALFGSRPHHGYQFLLALSDHVAHFGLEHHQSSDNRQRERVLIDEALRVLGAGLLPHEYVHSWNGKFRRPEGLVTSNFEQPVRTELLWIYEGLTTYLGEVLTARSGLRTAAEEREAMALTAAALDVARGRTWRPLADTAVAAQTLYGTPAEWRSWRRGVDFYPEGELIWLEVDALLRSKTGGQRSLDDFCRAFFGNPAGQSGKAGAPAVAPYTLDDVLAALAAVAPHDWRAFFSARLDAPTARAPLGGLETAGWRVVYRDTPTGFHKQAQQVGKTIDLSYSLGLLLREDGGILDAIPGAPAARAGVGPGMKVVAVNGRRFSGDVVRDAVAATRTRPDVELLVENGDFFRTHRLAYRSGPRYPALERIPGRPDLLEAILRPRAP